VLHPRFVIAVCFDSCFVVEVVVAVEFAIVVVVVVAFERVAVAVVVVLAWPLLGLEFEYCYFD